MREELELTARYLAACAPLLGLRAKDVEVVAEDRLVQLGPAWVAMEGPGVYAVGTTVHDPGVRYHPDGSGTPPTDDPVDIREGEGISEDGLVRGRPDDAARAVVLWHLRAMLDDSLTSEAMAVDLKRLEADGREYERREAEGDGWGDEDLPPGRP